ncbi:ATP-binding protein [Arthrobacter sp. SIMBA_036]|uniref:sensor histidine kinase n=1 Tax=Arthrobacter sp. SIMBA_036 TaxID=3085778 RepID=UPI00397AF8BB
MRRTRWGIRKRATATAVGVVAAALLVGAIVLLVLLQTSLAADAEGTARQKAQDVAAQLGDPDDTEAARYVSSTSRPDQIVQIINSAGAVVAASVPAAAKTPLTQLRPADGQTLTQDVSDLSIIGNDDEFLVVATGASSNNKTFTVVVAAAEAIQKQTIITVGWFILGATPVLLMVVGVSVWALVGRSLRQVERIRAQVAAINARRLDERVEVPSTADEIQALALTMNNMLERLESSDREQRRFVADASHELRSPLATLSAGVEIASADPTGETWRDMKGVLGEETDRMRYLVEDLLTLAKTNDERLEVDAIDVDLDDVVDAELRRLKSTGRNAINAHLGPARVLGDARQLGQAVRNILDNADRHATSRIDIDLLSHDGNAVLTIENDGPPIPLEERQRVFERFVRLDESRSRESGGSGLGLAIVAGIVAAHHGTVEAGETAAGTSRFRMVLPLVGS